MLSKTLRAFERSIGEDVSDRELSSEDITTLISVARVYVMKNCDMICVSSFCTMIDDICVALREGHFTAPASGKRKRQVTPKLASNCDIRWIDEGIICAFKDISFMAAFMRSLSDYVQDHAEEHATPFGTTLITTDNSIIAALEHLPRGYIEILRCLQNFIWKDTVLALFWYSTQESLGGPGSPGRLAIDLIESQLYSTTALTEKRFNEIIPLENNEVAITLGEVLGRDVISMLGPYPVNMAYGPLLQHAMFMQLQDGNYSLFNLFLDACCDDETGIHGDAVRVMGLHTFIGSFILNTKPSLQPERYENLLCRSQIHNEIIGSLLTVNDLRRLFACFCKAENYDDWVVLSFSSGCHLLAKYKFDILPQPCFEKLFYVLQSQEDSLKDLLDEENYEELRSLCSSVLQGEANNLPNDR